MEKFDTYHWQGRHLEDPELEEARIELVSPQSGDAARHAFTRLLCSDSIQAMGIALDHYHYALSGERHGMASLFAPYASDVLECARKILRRPPVSATYEASAIDKAACASALLVLVNEATPEDSDLIARSIEEAPGPDALSAALGAAGTILDSVREPSPRLVAVMERLIFDESVDFDERLEALQALAQGSSPVVMAVLVRASALEDLELQVTAVQGLGFHDMGTYRGLVEERSASWPEGAPYPAADVRRLLREDDRGSK
ncbi:hypothetical protein CG723_01305 [Streptomyces sp. CB01635]|uniref:hypothetical protein n=1 Tax=unclassified Streptomyces TaxID=2593676 RepID=UPI000C281156|nr:hypothetical protein [Streptomyces sp. CB01635]PJN13252.1 hypothetical protein CG723_01305 [Streptomyces sp. CB01635]